MNSPTLRGDLVNYSSVCTVNGGLLKFYTYFYISGYSWLCIYNIFLSEAGGGFPTIRVTFLKDESEFFILGKGKSSVTYISFA